MGSLLWLFAFESAVFVQLVFKSKLDDSVISTARRCQFVFCCKFPFCLQTVQKIVEYVRGSSELFPKLLQYQVSCDFKHHVEANASVSFRVSNPLKNALISGFTICCSMNWNLNVPWEGKIPLVRLKDEAASLSSYSSACKVQSGKVHFSFVLQMIDFDGLRKELKTKGINPGVDRLQNYLSDLVSLLGFISKTEMEEKRPTHKPSFPSHPFVHLFTPLPPNHALAPPTQSWPWRLPGFLNSYPLVLRR